MLFSLRVPIFLTLRERRDSVSICVRYRDLVEFAGISGFPATLATTIELLFGDDSRVALRMQV